MSPAYGLGSHAKDGEGHGLGKAFEGLVDVSRFFSCFVEIVFHAFKFFCFLVMHCFELLDEVFCLVKIVKGFFKRVEEFVILVEADEDAWHWAVTYSSCYRKIVRGVFRYVFGYTFYVGF